MLVSTKGRYALRVMIDLAQNAGKGALSLKVVADRQDVSLKYLESIVALLNKGGLVKSSRGKDGGYVLSKDAREISVNDVLRLTESTLEPVSCAEQRTAPGEQSSASLALPLWRNLDRLIASYLSGVTLQDLVEGRVLPLNPKEFL